MRLKRFVCVDKVLQNFFVFCGKNQAFDDEKMKGNRIRGVFLLLDVFIFIVQRSHASRRTQEPTHAR